MEIILLLVTVIKNYSSIFSPFPPLFQVNKRLAEYFKQLVKQSEKITSFSDPESTAVVDWFREAIKRAMAAIKDEEESTTYKRKFDSIGYHYRFGFGK